LESDVWLPVPSQPSDVAAAAESAAFYFFSTNIQGYNLFWREEAAAVVAHVGGLDAAFF